MLLKRLVAINPRRVSSRRALTLENNAVFRGAVLEDNPLNGTIQRWVNDPASADRVGRLRRRVGSTLTDVNFASLFTFSRASIARDYDANGVLTEYANNVPRQGYDLATKTPSGIRIEGTTTNVVRNPRAEGTAGAVPTHWTNVGGPAGLTRTITTETRNGVPGILASFVGTTTASGALYFQWESAQPASQGQVWASSMYAQVITDDPAITANQLVVVENDSGGAFLVGTNVDFQATRMSFLRRSHVRTFTHASAAQIRTSYASNTIPSGTAVNFAIWVGGFQLEQNYFVSSLMMPPPGTLATSSRSADILDVTGAAFTDIFEIGAPQGCVVLDVLLPQLAGPSSQYIVQIDDNSDTNRVFLRNLGGGGNVVVHGAAANVLGTQSASLGTVVAGTAFRAGIRWSRGVISGCMNGGSVISTPVDPLPALTRMRLGGTGAALFNLNGRIRQARAYGYAPSDAEFQAMCVLGA